MRSKKIVVPLVAIVMVASSIVSISSVYANTSGVLNWRKKSISGNELGKGIIGKVTGINGSVITIIGKDNNSYTVNAGTAKIRKGADDGSGSLSDINVGDMLYVRGTIVGASITAITIVDDATFGNGIHAATSTIKKSKKVPVVIGSVTAISGTNLTVMSTTTKKATTTTVYTVDASNAKIMKGSATSTAQISDIKVGDTVFVRGTINGTSIAATTIIDGVFKGNGKFGRHGFYKQGR